MKSQEQGVPRVAWVNRTAPKSGNILDILSQFFNKTFVITELEIRKLRHEPTDLFTRALQPVLWLLVFGQVLSRTRAIPTGNVGYLDFMSPGILAQSVLFISIFYGIAIIWERDLGIVHKFLASPTPRGSLVLGKALSAGIRGLSQAIIIYVLAVVLGVKVDWNPLALIGVLSTVMLGAALFSTFSLIIACIVKTREKFMGIGQVITMPLFFASNAIYPLSMMPAWLQVISRINPLTYEVDAMRALMLAGGTSVYGVGADFLVLIFVSAALIYIASQAYPKVVV